MKQRLTVLALALLAACQQPSGFGTYTAAEKGTLAAAAEPAAAGTVEQHRDTVTIGGRLLVWTDIDEATYEAVPELNPDTSEAVNLAKAPGRVRRSGDSLVFSLENGGQKVLVNNHNDGDDMAAFTFQAHLPQLRSWLVLNMGYEWFSYDLVNTRSGEVVRTIGIPQLSPDGKRFIAANADLLAQFNSNGFQLFEMRDNGPVLVQEYYPESWGPRTIKWKDADTFYATICTVNEQMEETVRYVRFSLPSAK